MHLLASLCSKNKIKYCVNQHCHFNFKCVYIYWILIWTSCFDIWIWGSNLTDKDSHIESATTKTVQDAIICRLEAHTHIYIPHTDTHTLSQVKSTFG